MMRKTIFTDEHKTTIEKLRSARKQAGLLQHQAARLLNRTQSYVSKVEKGQRRIDTVQLKEFARLYRKSINYFLKE